MLHELLYHFNRTKFGEDFNARHKTLKTTWSLVKSTIISFLIICFGIILDIRTILSLLDTGSKIFWTTVLILAELFVIIEWLYAMLRHRIYVKYIKHQGKNK